MSEDKRCQDCNHKEIAHSERGCDVGVKVGHLTVPCPCPRKVAAAPGAR